MANGITQDTKGEHLYVADSFGKSVTKFQRDPKTNKLGKLNEVRIGSKLDNLKYDSSTDSVYTGGLVASHENDKITKALPERLH